MELTDTLKALFRETAMSLKGSARRLFMARTVKELGKGGHRRAERELGWNRETIRKGMHELESGLICLDNFTARGRKPAEEHLPNLLTDLKAIVDSQSQADPQFRTQCTVSRPQGSPDLLLIKSEDCRILLRHKPFWRYFILDPTRMLQNAMRSAKCRESHDDRKSYTMEKGSTTERQLYYYTDPDPAQRLAFVNAAPAWPSLLKRLQA